MGRPTTSGMADFEFKSTKKGLMRAEFQDRFGATCSLQESSFPDEDCLWLGVEVDIHGNEIGGGRMHLTQEMAQQLIPILRHFARTGTLGVDDMDKRFGLGCWVLGVGPENRGVEGRITSLHVGRMVTVQDRLKPGEAGTHLTSWDAVEKYWEPIDPPDDIPTRYQHIMQADGEDPV